jgi:endonuclease/exonuclease/phosphatase family metal-dependent hydrolase
MAIPPSDQLTAAQLLATSAERLHGDIYLFQEVDHIQQRSGMVDQIATIARQIEGRSLGQKCEWRFAPTLIGTPGEKWRRTMNDEKFISAQLCSYGIGMISTIPITSWHRLDLGRSLIGAPLLIPTPRGPRPIYVRDEPRIAIAAITDSGWLVINTHLSFVPLMNKYQLRKLKRWAKVLGTEHGIASERIIIGGDLNLPAAWLVESKNWRSLMPGKTYPSWKPQLQFDYFLASKRTVVRSSEIYAHQGVSDHLAITIDCAD